MDMDMFKFEFKFGRIVDLMMLIVGIFFSILGGSFGFRSIVLE